MASRRGIRIGTGLAALLIATVAWQSAALASGFEYSSDKHQIKVAQLLVESARTEPGDPPSRLNLENPDPHIFWVLEISDLKPSSWEFVNPLAPSVVTDEVLARWDYRYENGGGFSDPTYSNGDPTGDPTRRAVGARLGDPVPKWSGAYWEVLLAEENFEALLGYDLLLITNHSLTAFSPSERDLLRRLVDAGAIVLVDDCGGMRICHANEEGQVPVTDFVNTPPAPLTADNDFLGDGHAYFGLSYFTSWGGGAGQTETNLFDYDQAPFGFFTPLQFCDDDGGSGYARAADPLNPLITTPYWLSQDELNEIGDKNVTTYRISAYDELDMAPVVANTAYETAPGHGHAEYGEPYVAMGYYGEGIIIACAGDIGCAIQDAVGDGYNGLNGQNNGGYWCGTDFSPLDGNLSYQASAKLFLNAVSLAGKYRQGFGGPRQQAAVGIPAPNAYTPSAEALTPPSDPASSWTSLAGSGAGHSYAATANNVIFLTVPDGGGDLHLVAIDAVQGRDLDLDSNPDDGFAGTPPAPLNAFAQPDFDVLWFAPLGGRTGTAPCIGKAAYEDAGDWYIVDVVFVAVDDEVHAFEAIPMAGSLIESNPANLPVTFDGWTSPLSLDDNATGLTYSRGRLYVGVGDDASNSATVEVYNAHDGTDIGIIEVPGLYGTLADAGSGPAVAIVQDAYNGCLDETVYLPVSPDGADCPRAEVLAVVLRTWSERLRPVGTTATGEMTPAGGGTAIPVSGCYRNWRVRDFARFDGDAGTAPDDDTAQVYVNDSLIDPVYWDFVRDNPAFAGAPDPDVPGWDDDWQQIEFVNGTGGRCLDGLCPGGTTEGVPADAEVTIVYDHKFPAADSFPIDPADAGSIKWRYVPTRRSLTDPPTYAMQTGANDLAHSRVAVASGDTVLVGCPITGGAAGSNGDTFHVLRDVGYPPDAYDDLATEPEPTAGAAVWNADELDGAGSFVFWQETLRPHMAYVAEFAAHSPGDFGSLPEYWWQEPSFAVSGDYAVVRTSQLPLHADDPDNGAPEPNWYSSYTTFDITQSLSVTLNQGTGEVDDPMPPLRWDWTHDGTDLNPTYTADYRPYGVRIYDAWTMRPIPYETLDGLESGVPTYWWVDPSTNTIHFKLATLAGRRILVQVQEVVERDDPSTAGDDGVYRYHHQYHQVPPIVVGQYPAMSARVDDTLTRPSYTGPDPVPAGGGGVADALEVYRDGGNIANVFDWVTPFDVDWDAGVMSFAPVQQGTGVEIDAGGTSETYIVSRVNEDFVAGDTEVCDTQIRSEAPPVIAQDKVLAHGWLASAGGSLHAGGCDNGILTFTLDPRDASFQDTDNEPWLNADLPWWPDPISGAAPSAPWPSFVYNDDGAADAWVAWWDTRNPSYDLLGESRGRGAMDDAPHTPRAPMTVTAGGVLTASLDVDPVGGDYQPIYQWYNSVETVIAASNRIVAVDSGGGMVRDIPSTGISESLGNLVLPGTLAASQISYKGISRPSSIRNLAYVGKPTNYHVCDSGNDQVLEIGRGGLIESRISNRYRQASNGDPGGYIAFYDAPAWYVNLPVGEAQTISSPHDAFRWEVTGSIGYGGVDTNWSFQFDWIADTGNNRLLGLMRQIPSDPQTISGREDEYHLIYASDSHQGLLDPTGNAIERGPALQYVTCWPVRSPLSNVVFEVADADAGANEVGFAGRNFAGIVAAVNNVALNTVPGDSENLQDLVNPGGAANRTDPFPRNLGPGASVVKVGRLYDGTGGGTLDAIDDQIQWAFSTIYVRGVAPTGDPALVPFKKLERIRYVDVELRTGTDVPVDDPAVYYITIVDEDGVYPVTYYPATGPWAADDAAYPGYAVLALPPRAGPFTADAGGYGATWWFDAQEYATTMGALARGVNPDPAAPGPDALPTWAGSTWGAPAYPAEYTGTPNASASAADTLLDDRTFSFFRPVHVELQADGRYLVTNGHERKGEVLLLDPFALDPASTSNPSAGDRRYDADYLSVLNWIVPHPTDYATSGPGAEEIRNVPSIASETYGLGQPWAASRRQSF